MLSDAIAAFDFAALRGAVALATSLAGESLPALDWAARLLIDIDPLKMAVPTILAVYAWLHPDRGCRADPVRAVRGAAGVVLALAIARGAQEVLPERPRPRDALPEFAFPSLGHLHDLSDVSSMPSDTAALIFALAAVAWAFSWRFGVASVAWAVVMTSLPRLYIGYHYLSDLLVGAALGVAAVACALRVGLPPRVVALGNSWLRKLDARAPALLPLAFFAFGAESLHAFETTRKMGAAASDLVQAISAEADAQPSPNTTDTPERNGEDDVCA